MCVRTASVHVHAEKPRSWRWFKAQLDKLSKKVSNNTRLEIRSFGLVLIFLLRG